MAKHRKQKKNVSQNQRLERPEVDEKLRQERILPIIASLKSPNLAERTVTLGALANIIEDPKMREMLLRERLLQVILSNTLSDSSLELVAEGFGVLRNIVLAEGRDTALFLVREQIRLPLNAVAAKSKMTLTEINSLDKQRLEMLNQVVENIFGLTTAIVIVLGELIEADDVARLAVEVAATYSQKILKRTYDAAFEVLYYLSEDNEQLLQEFSKGNVLETLKATVSNIDTWQSKIYELGIECNYLLLSGDLSSKNPALVSQLIEYLQKVPATETNSVQVCLELLALVAQTDNLEVLTQLLSDAVPRTLELISEPAFSLRGMSFINNVGWALNGRKENWSIQANTIFERALATCLGPENDGELITSTLGLLNAALIQNKDLIHDKKLLETFPKLFERVDVLYRQQDDEWVALASALVNTLGGVAAEVDLVAPTSDLIFSLLEHSDTVQSHIDALNALFDLFGDNEAPFNEREYNEKQLNSKLEQLRPGIKRLLKSSKGNDMLREQADDALLNLNNFIMYKKE